MDKAITTALLIIISMIMAMMLFNSAYPAVIQGGDAITSMANRSDEQMRSQVEIIHGAGELDSGGFWQDTNGNNVFEVFLWVKNIGESRLIAPEQTDVFFGPEANFTRIKYATDSSSGYPYWSYSFENGSDWSPNVTLKVTIHYAMPLSSGRYFAKLMTTSGVMSEYFMGI